MPEKKIHVKSVKKYRKYFQIEEDGLILCKKNKRGFAEHRIPMQRKLAMEISSVKTLELIQNSHGNFQVQNLREISMVNISMHLIENDDGNFQRQNLELIQNDQTLNDTRRKFPKAESGVDPK